MRGSDGVFLCADSHPVFDTRLKGIVWNELTNLLQSHDPKDLVYALSRLAQLSGPPAEPQHFDFDYRADPAEFDRRDVMDAVHGLITNSNDEVAQAAIDIIANDNPYTDKGNVFSWLAAVGGNRSFQADSMNPPLDSHYINHGAVLYGDELLAAATSKAASLTRAKAIAAFGPGRDLKAWGPCFLWLRDSSPDIRSSAALLTANFGEDNYQDIFSSLATDPSSKVRRALALAIGFGQMAHSFHFLPSLLSDSDAGVRQAAAASICSFAIKNATAAGFFSANLNQWEFGPLFLIALAGDNPADHLDDLARAVIAKRPVTNWTPNLTPLMCVE